MIIDKENTLLTLNLWIWLFNNPGMNKMDSPYWDKIKDMWGFCPLCHYSFMECKVCPGIWNKKYFFKGRYILYEAAKEASRLDEQCFAGAYYKWKLNYEKKYSGFIASNIRRYAKKQGYLTKE